MTILSLILDAVLLALGVVTLAFVIRNRQVAVDSAEETNFALEELRDKASKTLQLAGSAEHRGEAVADVLHEIHALTHATQPVQLRLTAMILRRNAEYTANTNDKVAADEAEKAYREYMEKGTGG